MAADDADVLLFRVRVKYDYDAEDETELTIGAGEILSIYKTSDNGWWFAEADDNVCGWVPSNFLEKLEEGVSEVLEEAEPVLLAEAEAEPAEIAFTEENSGPKVEERTVEVVLPMKKRDPLNTLDMAGPGQDGCGSCGRVLPRGYVMAGGKKFHEECFVCTDCEGSLLNFGFIEREGGLFCEKDYHKRFSPKCSHCKEPITDQYITALNRTYHPEHFVCKVCSAPFPDGLFHQYAEEPYCEEHFLELFAVKCGACAKPILGKGFAVEEIEKTFHEECFNCGYSDAPHRIKDGEDFHIHNGQIFCHTHFKELVLSKCARCKKVIEADYLTVKNQNFHVDCFKCEDCQASILDGKFSIFKDQMLCHGCAKKAKSAPQVAKVAPMATPTAPTAPAVASDKPKESVASKRADPSIKYGSAESRKANEEKVEAAPQAPPVSPPASGSTSAKNASSPAINPVDFGGPFHPYDLLKNKNTVPDGVDKTRKEMYLAAEEFQKVFGMNKAAFYGAPMWRQKKLKQDKSLF